MGILPVTFPIYKAVSGPWSDCTTVHTQVTLSWILQIAVQSPSLHLLVPLVYIVVHSAHLDLIVHSAHFVKE